MLAAKRLRLLMTRTWDILALCGSLLVVAALATVVLYTGLGYGALLLLLFLAAV